MSEADGADAVKPRLPQREQLLQVVLSDWVWWVLPTPCAHLFNVARMRETPTMPELPLDEWALSERRTLLTGSQERLASLEGKGPGLSTVTAVIVAGAVLAIASGWHESTFVGRVILGAAAFYTAMSLVAPLYLVGPLKHPTITAADLTLAAESDEPEQTLAIRAADASMANDLQNQRITNLLDAARRELSYAFFALVLWVVVVPFTGLLVR